ncbi:zinc-binding dehydrogenase [Atopomonas sediminilitoris]|uniref:zinc-binding dehydrogenase n=1 Tax=Atopomonas sediminilitoris TaxID=2919919 RepID=UPI001F4E07AC|nr:zinc-binding dehydrogenase [Atopomonas sediminilitoris]MCJ8168251.1 zinc-binding dehydrogenase [Atopomonas sediminilitoris]
MRRLIVPRAGKPEVLQLETVADLQPAAGEVRVRVRAAGLNFADVMARQGLYPDAPPFPTCLGYEFAGEVDALGAGVEASWLGRRVFGLSRFNAQAEQVCVPLAQVFAMPATLDFAQAAAIPVNYLTAWQLLVVMGSLQADETVLIHNIGGGVGLAALQIAKQRGARVLGTASGGKHAALKAMGVDGLIDYRQGPWEPELAKLTEGRGVELIIDPIGGSHLKRSLKALRSTGRVGTFGISAATQSGAWGKLKLLGTVLGMPWLHPVGLMEHNRGAFGVNMGHLWHETAKVRIWMQALLDGVEAGWLKPHVHAQFALDEAAQAHQCLEQRQNLGKVVLLP